MDKKYDASWRIIIIVILFYFSITYAIIATILLFGKLLFSTIYYGLIYSKSNKADKIVEQSGIKEQKELEIRMVEAEKEQRHKEQVLNKQNQIIQSGLNVVREMRIRYPYADEELFQRMLKKFSVMSVEDIDNLQKQIKLSHMQNERIPQVTIERNYNLADLNGLVPLEEQREDPVVMKIYKINSDYIIYIRDIDINSHYIAQSKDYLVVFRIIARTMEFQKNLNKLKQHITAKQLDDICKEVIDGMKSFRRNILE